MPAAALRTMVPMARASTPSTGRVESSTDDGPEDILVPQGYGWGIGMDDRLANEEGDEHQDLDHDQRHNGVDDTLRHQDTMPSARPPSSSESGRWKTPRK